VYAAGALDENGEVSTSVPPPAERTTTTEELTQEESAADSSAAEAPSLQAAATELPLCGGADYVVGPALYKGVQVVVAIDSGRRIALAYIPDSCSVLASVALP